MNALGRSIWIAMMGSISLPVAAPAAELRLDSAASELRFTFTQAGARSEGRFRVVTATAMAGPNWALQSLIVTAQTGSVDTADKERDQTLRGADLFDATRFPTAEFKSTAIKRLPNGNYEATGLLRIRDQLRTVRLPLAPGKPGTAAALILTGATTLRRLDYGVGQGEWKSTEWVANDVRLDYKLALVPKPSTAR